MSQKLGKAKRQRLARQAKCGTPVTITGPAGEPVQARHAGMTYTEAWSYAGRLGDAAREGRSSIAAHVPCDGCTACCYSERIDVNRSKEPAERLAHLDLVPDPYGDMKLRKRDDGSCVHLIDGRCSVYEHRPMACRTYDCRVSNLMGMRRAYPCKDGAIEEPLWQFDRETRNDKILRAGLSHFATQIREKKREIGVPDDPNELAGMITRQIERTRAAFDMYDRETAHMTPAEKARFEIETFGRPV